MRILRLILLSAILVFGLWVANQHNPFGSSLPAMGSLLSPYTGFWQQAEPTAQPASLSISFPELSETVTVVMDDRLVPHIFAANIEDAAFVQGYLAATYRLWQMDISVRATVGRLAEVLGENLLERDRLQRRKGLLWAAERAVAGWKNYPEEWAVLEAYTAGANKYINNLTPAQYPLEFKLLGYKPEPWTPLNSAIFSKSMAETLSSRNRDLPASNMLAWLGEEQFDFLFPEWNPKQSPVIPASVEWNFEPVTEGMEKAAPASLPIGQSHPYRTFPLPPESVGSNNWAVAGSKTASGNPILCNDPHLNLTLPAIWYEIQLHTPEFNAYGVSLPGIPGIIIGFNNSVAWGVTNVGQDVLDWYTIDWADEQKESYYLDGQAVPVDKLVEVIHIRGRAEPVLDTVRYTQWGPVVYESSDSEYRDLAMRWIAHDKPGNKSFGALGTYLRLLRAESYKDYYEALKAYENPGQNFVFASRDGDIAITVNGKFPIKNKEQGRFIQNGSSIQNAWDGFIPYEQLPRVQNPERGFVSSANQHSTAPDYPYYYNGGFDDYRGRYINRRLDSLEEATVEDMKALQLENYSIKAEEGVPVLLSLVDSAEQALLSHPSVELLRQWDYRFDADSKAAVLFQRWLEVAYRNTFDEFYAQIDSMEVLFPESWRFLELLAQHPEHAIFDQDSTDQIEMASDIITASLEEALASATQQSWSEYQQGIVPHLGRIDAFSQPLPGVGGYADAPNAFKGSNGPSWRMIVELGDEVEAYGVYPGGQSGNPGSPFYKNMIKSWSNGQYNQLYLYNNIGEAKAAAMTTLSFSKGSKKE